MSCSLRLLFFLLVVSLLGCSQETGTGGEVRYAASIKPVAMILTELVRGHAEVRCILSPSASPHTYEATPSDAAATEGALALFYAADSLDSWATKLPAKRRDALFRLVPPDLQRHGDPEHHHDEGHEHGADEMDAHFWTDPTVVASLVPGLVATLSELDPPGAPSYKANGDRFIADLAKLDAEVAAELAPVKGRTAVLFHPSFLYLLHRYDLIYGGTLEPAPGREASLRHTTELVARLKGERITAVFTEPQLSRAPAEAVAEAVGARLFELDPYGGSPGRETYRECLLWNAHVLREALAP